MTPRTPTERNRIKGVDAIAGLALQAWAKRAATETARLDSEEVESLRRQKINWTDKIPESLNVDLLKNQNLHRFRNALSANTGAAGATIIPNGFVEPFELALDALPMRRLARVLRVDRGSEHSFPLIDDRTNGAGHIITENTGETEYDAVFGRQVFRPYKASSGRVLVPFELTQDGERFAEQLGTLLGRRIARIQNSLATTGTGSGQPSGVSETCTKTTAAGSSAVTGDDLISLMSSASDSAFDAAKPPVFMMSKATLFAIQKLKDGNGRYLLHQDSRQLFGFSIVVNSAMPSTIASGTVSVLFGDFSRVQFIEVNDIRLDAFTDTNYASADQVLFRAILRFDVAQLDPGDHPVVGLQH